MIKQHSRHFGDPSLDLALEDEKPPTVNQCMEWNAEKGSEHNSIGSRPRDQLQCIERDNTKSLIDEARDIYASKSLTNRLCLKMELYSSKMEEGDDLHDHINSFNRLVCQLLNTDNKIEDEEQALLLLASLPKFYKPQNNACWEDHIEDG